MCGFAQPFMGKQMDLDYAHLYGPTKTYIGFSSGFHCVGPMQNTTLFTEPMTEDGYTCAAPPLASTMQDSWNEKWYSPVCRSWFKA